MTLAIISHTEHYKDTAGTVVGWGPTVNEINHLLYVFDTIYHVAMFHQGVPPPSSLPYVSDRVIFIPLPAVGGKTITHKTNVLLASFRIIAIVNATLKKADYFQLRTPTGIGVFLIPYLTFFSRTEGWYKYAGNWAQERAPLGYRLQRAMLKKQKRKVTINGRWPGQSANLVSFENPCLTDLDLIEGATIAKQKSLDGKIQICYVGRLETPKGVAHLIRGIGLLSNAEKERIEVVHLVGNGVEIDYFKKIAAPLTEVRFEFHGFLDRNAVFEIYKKSHLFLMPTMASEGFPKVIAEAMNFGCIPVVSVVSSIGQYIKNLETGICIYKVTDQEVADALTAALQFSNTNYQHMISKQRDIVNCFSFSHYNHRIKTEVLV